MKLSLNTHNLCASLSRSEVLGLCRAHGIPGVEWSVGYGHAHGVELERSAGERRRIRDEIYASGTETVSVATYCRFDMEDEGLLHQNVEQAKQAIVLAADLGSPVLRVVGNDLPEFLSRDAFIARVAGVLNELGAFAGQYGVDVLLNMHGTFQFRRDMAELMKQVDSPHCGLVYNCDPGDLSGGSAAVTLETVAPYVRHVHLHELTAGYPYREMFRLLGNAGYRGWYSIVVDDPSPETGRLLSYYCALARAWEELAGHDRKGGCI